MMKVKVKSSKLKVSQGGFTLVELLAVMVVLVTIGGIIGTILFGVLRGNNKTNALAVVRQNGVYATRQMAKMLRDARSFDGVSTDNVTYTTLCGATSGSLTPTPTPTPVDYKYIKITSFDDEQTVFSCSTAGVSSNSASLVDTAAVHIDSCTITCLRPTLSNYPTINISLSLSATSGGTVQLQENQGTIDFQSSVSMRNINR